MATADAIVDSADPGLDVSLALLDGTPIFRGLTLPQLSAVALRTRKAYFQPAEPIVIEGERGDTAYLLISGLASTDTEMLEAGALIGELAMLSECSYPITVMARDRVRAIAIDRDALREVMEADPAIARHLADRLLMRLAALADELRRVDAHFAAIEASLDEAMAVG